MIDTERLRLEIEGPLRYLYAIPRSRPAGPHPVLLFLHGYDEGAPAEIEEALTRHGPLQTADAFPALDDWLIVAPQLPGRGDIWYRYADAVQGILRNMQQRHGGDPLRAYLTGFSFGGNGVFELAAVQPGMWSALWAVDATRVPQGDPGRPVWLSFGEVARYNKDRFIAHLGLIDFTGHMEPNRVYLDEGADHVGSATRAYQDPRIYRWLLSKRLAKSRMMVE
jgi:poly(3-hydroxybutyrate) depolymerase